MSLINLGFILPNVNLVSASSDCIKHATNHIQNMDITPVLANFILGIPQQNLKCSLCFHVWRQVMNRFSVLGSSIIYFDILEQLLIFPDYQHLYDELLNNITWCFQETENFLKNLLPNIFLRLNILLIWRWTPRVLSPTK